MIGKQLLHKHFALLASITVTILSWSYMVVAVGGKLIAPSVI